MTPFFIMDQGGQKTCWQSHARAPWYYPDRQQLFFFDHESKKKKKTDTCQTHKTCEEQSHKPNVTKYNEKRLYPHSYTIFISR
ncbi:MAG: hypothetical protein CSA20_05930 [Deltaproteobacteria bacterium]|nr:MAG: hypothetical protein CSA20_05930 [Deltaproteobacteria bacterium]